MDHLPRSLQCQNAGFEDRSRRLPDVGNLMGGSGTNGHNTKPGFASGSGGWERGSGQPHAIFKPATATAVANQLDKTRDGKGPEHSKRNREKNKNEFETMMTELEKMTNELERLRKKYEERIIDLDDFYRKVDVLRREVQRLKENPAKYKEDYDHLQNQKEDLKKRLENMSSPEEENARLKAETDLLMQELYGGTGAKKKWVKIPLENRLIEVKGNVLMVKRT